MAGYIQAAALIISSIKKKKETREAAKEQKKLGRLAAEEGEAEAQRRGAENVIFGGRQKLSFLKQGVQLADTPLLVLRETKKVGERETTAIRRRAGTQRNIFRLRSRLLRSQSRTPVTTDVAGVFSGIQSEQGKSKTQSKTGGSLGGGK